MSLFMSPWDILRVLYLNKIKSLPVNGLLDSEHLEEQMHPDAV